MILWLIRIVLNTLYSLIEIHICVEDLNSGFISKRKLKGGWDSQEAWLCQFSGSILSDWYPAVPPYMVGTRMPIFGSGDAGWNNPPSLPCSQISEGWSVLVMCHYTATTKARYQLKSMISFKSLVKSSYKNIGLKEACSMRNVTILHLWNPNLHTCVVAELPTNPPPLLHNPSNLLHPHQR